jgi:Transposase IS4
VWAKSTAVSRDCKRIYGVECDKIYLRGIVMEVLIHRPEGARRSTTLIKAKYTVGDGERVKVINIAQLKKEDPNPPVAEQPPAVEPTTEIVQAPSQNDQAAPGVTTSPHQDGATVATHQSASTASTGHSQIPVATCHGREWRESNTELPTNGPFIRKSWKFICQYTGKEFTPGCDPNKEIDPIDFFMAVFPKKQLQQMIEETNKKLVRSGDPKLTKGELLKWFGILILITRFEYGERAHLWSNRSHCKYIPAPNFGEKTGMTRERFHAIFREMVWSVQPQERPASMSSEQYRWLLIEDFITHFNEHRSQYFLPSWLVCADESISRWYGLGGHWINTGLPMYVAMDRKPEDGMEIQNACCAHSGIMLQLKLVKTAEANAEYVF